MRRRAWPHNTLIGEIQLPVDYFQKLSEATKAKAQFDNASKEMPIGIRYFTSNGEEDKARALAKQQALSNGTMSDTTRHFQGIEDKKEAASQETRRWRLGRCTTTHQKWLWGGRTSPR